MLLLSLITLFAGPLLFQWVASAHPLARTLDRIIVVVLVLLVALLLIPDIIEPLSWWAPAFLVLGYLLPSLLERVIRRAAETLHLLSLYVALLGLLLHAVLDGAGLAESELRASGSLAAAIILHRFGMGLTLWLIMQPVFGNRIAWATLFAMAASTIIGFEFSERLLPYADDTLIAAVQGVIVGTIIHSLVHREHVRAGHHHDHAG